MWAHMPFCCFFHDAAQIKCVLQSLEIAMWINIKETHCYLEIKIQNESNKRKQYTFVCIGRVCDEAITTIQIATNYTLPYSDMRPLMDLQVNTHRYVRKLSYFRILLPLDSLFRIYYNKIFMHLTYYLLKNYQRSIVTTLTQKSSFWL